MFGFFKRKKSEEDPLSDLKTVSRWMQELPAGDIYTAQEQVVQSLIQFNHAGLPMSKDRLQVLMHLDNQARDMQYSLCIQYLRNPRMSKVIESRLWTAIHAFYWEVTRGYHTFIMDFVGNPGGSKIQPAIPQIAGRALRGFADIFKWRYFRYEKVEDKLWLRMHNLYRICEFDGFQNTRMKMYATDSKPSSCMDEYVQALLLSPLGAGSLSPKQIEMVDHWLDNWMEETKLENTYDEARHFFYIDTDKGHGLKRIRPNAQIETSFRFIDTERLQEHIKRTERALKSGALAPGLGLGEDFRLPDGYDLLNHAANEWAATNEQERRTQAREPAQGRCEVVRDLHQICKRIEHELAITSGSSAGQKLSSEEILDIKLYGFVTERTKSNLNQRTQRNRDLSAEQWPLLDRSDSGLGVLLKGEESEWVKVGKLLAIRLDPTHPWQIGVIRRITRMHDDMRKIGVETLASPPILVQLETHEISVGLSYSVEDNQDSQQNSSQALIFPELHGMNLILMESARYAHGRQFNMRDQNGIRMIRLDSVRDKGDGWLMATYFQAS
jgi:cyclic-di-GMP-binding protein